MESNLSTFFCCLCFRCHNQETTGKFNVIKIFPCGFFYKFYSFSCFNSGSFFFFFSVLVKFLKYFYLFWLCWVFLAAQAFLQLWQARATLQFQCTDFALCLLLLEHRLQNLQASVIAAPRFHSTGSIVLGHRLSCSMAYGIFPDQGSNPCLMY